MPNAVDEIKLKKAMIGVKGRVAKKKASDEMLRSAIEQVQMRVRKKRRKKKL